MTNGRLMQRDYIYHSHTRTMCANCRAIIDGKIVYDDNGVYILKNCPECGSQKALLEDDYDYHLLKARYQKPTTVSTVQTQMERGCPHDCGLCPSHEQHTCIGLIEITKRCQLACNGCFAKCGSGDLSMDQIERMMDFYIEAEDGKAEILQISGGEPTLHPDILRIIELAKAKGFGFVMLNTNGIRIATDKSFARELAVFRGGFEVYLQFDGTSDRIYKALRNQNMMDTKHQALANLAEYRVPTTLVCTVAHGINDKHIGELVAFSMNTKPVRGINFQPFAYYGNDAPGERRATLSGILRAIESQTSKMLLKSDFMPLPCDPDRVAITYLLRDKSGRFVPLTRGRDMTETTPFIGNTLMFTVEDTLKGLAGGVCSSGACACWDVLSDIRKRLPKGFLLKPKEEMIRFVDEETFRISVSSFVDRFNFDMKSMQMECVHIITPDLKRIPFSAFNMLHRERYDGFYV